MPKSPAEIRITTGTIIGNRYYNAGEVLPFTRIEDLPESLRGLIADGSENFFHPREIDFYNNPQAAPAGFVFQGVSSGQWVQRQASQVAGAALEQDWAAEQLEREHALPKETIEALEAEHSKHAALAKAQLRFARDQVDAIYERAAQEAEPPRLYVKRGGEMGRIERSKLKVGEAVYAKFDNGDWQVVGYVDATGQAPPPPLIP